LQFIYFFNSIYTKLKLLITKKVSFIVIVSLVIAIKIKIILIVKISIKLIY